MEKYLYHGSIVSDITELHPNSKTHDGQNALYLTDSFPYSLFYIWDSEHNIKKSKHITSWIKDGVVYYEEQFENQLERFYDGVSGYVYIVSNTEACFKVTDRESMWYSHTNISVIGVRYIQNVYEEIQQLVTDGKIKIISHDKVDKNRLDMINKHIFEKIKREKLFNDPESEKAKFYREFFSTIWEKALIYEKRQLIVR